jgi:hypothetical protein
MAAVMLIALLGSAACLHGLALPKRRSGLRSTPARPRPARPAGRKSTPPIGVIAPSQRGAPSAMA